MNTEIINQVLDAAIIETGVDDVTVLDSGLVDFGSYTATLVSHAQR